jgi:peptidoglycan hydrolase CwlO-like protein
MKYEEKLEKENKKLKRENKNLLYEIKCWYKNRKERDKRMLELEEENEELKKKLDILYHHV